MSRLILFVAVVATLIPTTHLNGGETAAISEREILAQMESADEARLRAFRGYVGTRLYTIENTRFHVNAKMTVEVTVDDTGRKTFRVLEMSGPSAVRKMVFQRMLETEQRASLQSEQAGTRISPKNYTFALTDVAHDSGRTYYVLTATPKTDNPLLFRGRIWVDAADYAVVRIQGSPARNPSFWVRKTQFEHRYEKHGPLWLAASNNSESDVMVFGQTKVRIAYLDYRLNEPNAVATE